MILILSRLMCYAMVALFLLKGILSFSSGENVRLVDRFGGNLKDRYLPAAIGWLCFVELMMFQGWSQSMSFAYTVKDQGYTGVAVLVLWAWTFMMSVMAPFLAGFRKWWGIIIASILMLIESCSVLILL